MEIKVLKGLNREEVEKAAREIRAVSQKAFTTVMSKGDTVNYFRKAIRNPKNINIVAIGKDGVIYAHLLAIPHCVAFKELRKHDLQMRNDHLGEAIYIESIASIAHERVFMHLLNATLREAKARGRKKGTMHIRTINHLNSVLCDMYPLEFFRRIGNWYGFGEPFDYYECKFSEVKWLNK